VTDPLDYWKNQRALLLQEREGLVARVDARIAEADRYIHRFEVAKRRQERSDERWREKFRRMTPQERVERWLRRFPLMGPVRARKVWKNYKSAELLFSRVRTEERAETLRNGVPLQAIDVILAASGPPWDL
jgi:hypothetical protein